MDLARKQEIVSDVLTSAKQLLANDDLKLRLLRSDYAFLERLTALFEQDVAYSQ